MKLYSKPKEASRLVIVFNCDECRKENTVYENYTDWHDTGDGDSLDFACECGNYYKKIHRIEDKNIKETYFEIC